MTTIAFLPLVSASSRRSGRQPRNSAAVSRRAGQDHRVDVRVRHEPAPGLPLVGVHELQDVGRDAGRVQRRDADLRAAPAAGRA